MKILVVLRNIYHNPDLFDDEQYLCKSDRNILAEAVMLKEKYGGDITALLFAEDVEDSEKALKKACTYGADQVFHIVLDKFDFSDTSTFSRVISRTLQQYFREFDLLLFGRLAYDGDSVNIATQTAHRLGIPAIMYSKEILAQKEERREDNQSKENSGDSREKRITVRKMVSDLEDIVYDLELPALVQSMREKGVTRQPKMADIIRTYSEVEVKKIDGDRIARKVRENKGKIVLYRKSELEDDTHKELQLLNGMSDKESSMNLIEILSRLGFEGDI